MNDFEKSLQEVLQMTPEEVMSVEVDPFVEEAFRTFEEMDVVVSSADKTAETSQKQG